MRGLNSIQGVQCQTPPGAFYAFANVKSFGKPASEITNYLLNEAGVALNPGTAFGAGGEGYIRLSYAYNIDSIEEGIKRMAKGLDALR